MGKKYIVEENGKKVMYEESLIFGSNKIGEVMKRPSFFSNQGEEIIIDNYGSKIGEISPSNSHKDQNYHITKSLMNNRQESSGTISGRSETRINPAGLVIDQVPFIEKRSYEKEPSRKEYPRQFEEDNVQQSQDSIYNEDIQYKNQEEIKSRQTQESVIEKKAKEKTFDEEITELKKGMSIAVAQTIIDNSSIYDDSEIADAKKRLAIQNIGYKTEQEYKQKDYESIKQFHDKIINEEKERKRRKQESLNLSPGLIILGFLYEIFSKK